jgi:hypothetical protein
MAPAVARSAARDPARRGRSSGRFIEELSDAAPGKRKRGSAGRGEYGRVAWAGGPRTVCARSGAQHTVARIPATS